MNIGEVLSKAWRIIWKHKILWIFGILGGCGGYNNSSGNLTYQFSGNDQNVPENVQILFQDLIRFFERIPVWVYLLLILVGIVLFLVAVFINTIGRIGLIKGAAEADEGVPGLSFGRLFNTSLPYFWRVFLLNLLVGLALIVIAIVFAILISLIVVLTLGVALLCLIPLVCLLIPLSWALTLIIEQSTIAIIVEDKGIMEGLSRGWEVVTKNLGMMIIMALILFIGSGILTMLISLPVFIVLMPLFFGLIYGSSTALRSGGLVSLLLLVIYFPVLLVASGILRAYISSTWTLTFRRLTGKGPVEPVIPSFTEVAPPSGIPPA
jgi:hypothetical protein